MKKKILFLILLLIPFIVKAVDVRDFSYKWKSENEALAAGTYTTDKSFIYFDATSMFSVDRATGKMKTVHYNGESTKVGNSIIIFSSNFMNPNDLNIKVYDEELNEINTNKIQNLKIIYAGPYSDEYAIVAGNEQKNNENYLKVMFIDKDGNIAKTETIKTIALMEAKANVYLDKYPVFVDFNNNSFIVENNQVKSLYTNSDGTYMFLTNNRLYKRSSTGEDLSSVEIPNGKGTRMAKKDNKYYVQTASYETVNNKIKVTFTFYLIDENLNILKTNTITEEDLINYSLSEEGYERTVHSIFNDNGTIRYNLQYSTYGGHSRELNENLEVESTNYYNHDSYDYYSFIPPYDYSKGLQLRPQNIKSTNLTEEEHEILYETLTKPSTYYVAGIKIDKGYVGAQLIITCEGVGCTDGTDNYKTYEQLDLVYLDFNYNEISRKTIYDKALTIDFNNGQETSYNIIEAVIYPYENHIITSVSGADGIKIDIYDNDFNLVKELYRDTENYNHLSAEDIYPTDKDLYFSFIYDRHSLDGASMDLNNPETLVLPIAEEVASPYDVNSLILCFSRSYVINKKVTGGGNITSTVENAGEGEVIRVTITPDPGYVLSVVRVIDSKGNVLTFTNNTFVMPASDVIIEATFVPINPKTSDIAILAITLIALASAFILLTQKKKLDFLK